MMYSLTPKSRELDVARQRAAMAVALCAAWSLAALILLGRDAVAAFFGEPQVATVLAVLALQSVVLPLSSPAFARLSRELAFSRIFGLQIACNAVQAAVSLALAWRGWGPLALAWGVVANSATQTVLLHAMQRGDYFFRPAFAQVGEVLRFGWRSMASRGLETLTRNAHEPIIAKQFDFASVGLFSRAWGMVELFHSNVADAVLRVSTPAFAQAHREGQPLADAFARATALYVSIAWPFFVFVALMAEPIIRVLFGAQWVAAAPLASILALAALPAGLYELVPQMLSATGHVQRRLRIGLVVAPVHITGVWLAAQHSLAAVAAVSFVTALLMLSLCVWELRRGVGVGARVVAKVCARSLPVALAASAAMGAAALGLQRLAAPALIAIMVTVAVGATAWWLAATALHHPMRDELQAIWRRTRTKGVP
jgi:O-antigen/teichoic acid export membrane protein